VEGKPREWASENLPEQNIARREPPTSKVRREQRSGHWLHGLGGSHTERGEDKVQVHIKRKQEAKREVLAADRGHFTSL
jgi:hypothetical protein